MDKNIEFQQNLAALPLAVIVLDAPSNALSALLPFLPFLVTLLDGPLEHLLYVITAAGVVHRLARPRP